MTPVRATFSTAVTIGSRPFTSITFSTDARGYEVTADPVTMVVTLKRPGQMIKIQALSVIWDVPEKKGKGA